MWQRFKHSWDVSATQPTAWSSRSSKILERMRRRSGTVMMRTKGNASEASVDFTTHRATMHSSCVMVNMFMRHVFTCSDTHAWRLTGRKTNRPSTTAHVHEDTLNTLNPKTVPLRQGNPICFWLHLVENSALNDWW